MKFGESMRMLRRVATLRRQYLAWFFIGAGLVPVAFYFPLYLDRVFHLGSFAIGVLVAAGNALALAGVQLSGRLTACWLARDIGHPLEIAGAAVIGVAPGLLVMAVAPNIVVASAGMLVAFFVAGWFIPPFFTVQALVSPARVRSLSFAVSSLFLVGGFVAFLVAFGSIANGDIRAGIASLVPWWVTGGVILASAHRFVAGDAAQAAVALAAATLRADGPPYALTADRIDAAYGQVQVLFGAGIDVGQGEVIALLGTNGAGKSTLLKSLAGLLPLQGGQVHLGGREITWTGTVDRVNAGLVMAPGGKGVFPSLTVEENLRLAEWTVRRDEQWRAAARQKVFTLFPALRDRLGARAGALSGGEQQMLTIAQALICRPRVLMIDELSLGLAPVVVAQLLDAVRSLIDEGVTVIVVEQSLNVATSLASRAVFMERGEVRFSGPTAELTRRPDLLRSVFLGAGAAREGDGDAVAIPQPPRDSPPALQITDVARSFGGVHAVRDVSLAAAPGEIVGIIGANGAGKTTLLDICSGFLPADHGCVAIRGVDATGLSAAARAGLGLGRVFQDARLFPSLTVTETLAVACERHIDVRDAFACSFHLAAAAESERTVAKHVDGLIERFGLGHYRDALIADLSTGTRRVVELACVFAHRPRILLLDEPSSGIAQREVEALAGLLRRLCVDTGAAFVIVEHDVPLVASLAHRLVCLDQGRVIAEGPPTMVLDDPAVIRAYLGSEHAAVARSGSPANGPAAAYLSTAEFADATGLSAARVRTLVRTGRLAADRDHRGYRIPAAYTRDFTPDR